ncbi:hypothetical protein VTI74DRAFT_3856 [Chaetomium olivicolor]
MKRCLFECDTKDLVGTAATSSLLAPFHQTECWQRSHLPQQPPRSRGISLIIPSDLERPPHHWFSHIVLDPLWPFATCVGGTELETSRHLRLHQNIGDFLAMVMAEQNYDTSGKTQKTIISSLHLVMVAQQKTGMRCDRWTDGQMDIGISLSAFPSSGKIQRGTIQGIANGSVLKPSYGHITESQGGLDEPLLHCASIEVDHGMERCQRKAAWDAAQISRSSG